MFLEYGTEVDADLAFVEKKLDSVRGSVTEWADIAYRNGEDLRAKVGAGGVAKEVTVEIGVAELHSYGIVYPITWTATDAKLLFPVLKADLILTKLGSARTRLTLRGTYEPPMGFVGRVADKAGLGRIANATVRSWLDRVAEEITTDVRTQAEES